MQFQIPQFIEVENKIVGPLTLKQFLYLAVAAAFSFMFYFIFVFWLWLFLTAVIGAIAVSLAFIKYNGQPLPKVALSALSFFWRPRFYLWQKTTADETLIAERETLRDFFSEMPSVKKLWQEMLTTKNPIPKREKGGRSPYWGKPAKEKFQVFRKATGEKDAAKRVDYR